MDSTSLIAIVLSGCCCSLLFLVLVGGGVYFFMKKKGEEGEEGEEGEASQDDDVKDEEATVDAPSGEMKAPDPSAKAPPTPTEAPVADGAAADKAEEKPADDLGIPKRQSSQTIVAFNFDDEDEDDE